MELNDALKKIERLEHDTRVFVNRLNRQQLILDEFVALLEIQCKDDIKLVEIRVGNEDLKLPHHVQFTIVTTKECLSSGYSDSFNLGCLVDTVNNEGKFRLTLDKRYRGVPLSKLPIIKQKNLYTNNCLIIIKL